MDRHTVTAETGEGRRAIEEVMRESYQADIDDVPPAWARALVVDGVPVSFTLVDPNEALPLRRGKLRSAFISDVATREDRRGCPPLAPDEIRRALHGRSEVRTRQRREGADRGWGSGSADVWTGRRGRDR